MSPRLVEDKDSYYLKLTETVSTRSKDPSTQCGAVAVAKDGTPLGMGYNGVPSRIKDSDINWERPFKYDFILHSEVNSISHSDRSKLHGATMYVNNRPCPNCMLHMVDAGFDRVCFINNRIKDEKSSLNDTNWQISKKIAELAAMKLESFSYDDTTGIYIRGSL